MSRFRCARALAIQVVLPVLVHSYAFAQHEHMQMGRGDRLSGTVGVQAVGLVTHVTPAILGKDLTEGYVTQPMIMAHAAYRWLSFQGTIDFEGLTLKRGELNHGVWGEGYI